MDRCEKLLGALAERDIDAAVITSPSGIRYLSGFTGSSGVLLIAPSRRTLITDFRYLSQAKRESPGFDAKIVARSEENETLFRAARDAKLKRIGFEAQSVTVARHEGITRAMRRMRLEPIDAELAALRAVKSQDELSSIREAAKIADEVFRDMLSFLRPGKTENEAAAYLEYRLRLQSEGPSFPPIIASGDNGALPHAKPTSKELKAGELIVMDFGAKVNGYCSDMTRTVAIGSADERAREVYSLVLSAQQNALDALRAGIPAHEADEAARKIIREVGYGEQFGHGLGHGVGLDIHEAPTLNASSNEALKEDMVVTVEPGIYIPGRFGVRIEDLCRVIGGGAENYTSSEKDFVVI